MTQMLVMAINHAYSNFSCLVLRCKSTIWKPKQSHPSHAVKAQSLQDTDLH